MPKFRTYSLAALLLCAQQVSATMPPTDNPDLDYPDFLTEQYDNNITPPKELLGFEVGEKAATPAQIITAIETWATQSDRMQVTEYARSHEGRPLVYVAISAADNISNLDGIQDNIQQLAHPTDISASQREELITKTPATAWMAYSIHGNESSGSDSALALIYHLIAAQSETLSAMLDDMIVFVDPSMNPDGRERFTQNLTRHRGSAPNVDVQSLLHADTWPWGRTNHYLFDLNRDFYFLVHPESRGRVAAINDWYPQLMIDGHEQGALDNYLFGPPREPINPHIPARKAHWGKVFAGDQADAYDAQNWRYYTGEWFENLYPGYSNYSEYRGSVHILYEQARTAEDGVRLRNGNIRTYQESVHHQYVSAIANLKTLATHSDAMYRDFVEDRLSVMSSDSPYAERSWVVPADGNPNRIAKLVELLQAQDIRVHQTRDAMRISDATDHLGNTLDRVTVPAGSLVIPNRQPEARLLAAIMEFETPIKPATLKEERQKTLRDGSSVMYDVTAWNLSMMLGLPTYQVADNLGANLPAYQSENATVDATDNALGFAVDGLDDRSVAFAARLLEQGYKARVLDKAAVLGETELNRGSVVVLNVDNPNVDVATVAAAQAGELGISLHALTTGLGDGDLPDIGSEHFQLLEKPRLAIAAYSDTNFYDFGAIWHLVDSQLGIRHSHLQKAYLQGTDLRAYNTLVLPDSFGPTGLNDGALQNIMDWVDQGGTLIAIGNSAARVTQHDSVSVATLRAAIEDTEPYDLALQRERLAANLASVDTTAVYQHAAPTDVSFPWAGLPDPMPTPQLKNWEQWTGHFDPSGAMVAGQTDALHWLTYGSPDHLPLLWLGGNQTLLTNQSAQAAVRVGVLHPSEDAEAARIGWSSVPAGQELRVRMSGLLWPEAAQRISNAVYLARQSHGEGQVILFAGQPVFRGATQGTARLLLNAIVYGSGLGADAPVIP